jgi:hypothetical protein
MDDGFEGLLGPIPKDAATLAPVAPQKDGFEQVLGPLPAVPFEERMPQAVLNGLSFGLRPRIAAWMEAGTGDGYDAALKREWAKDDAYAAQNPKTAFASEVVGALPTLLVPGLGAGRVGQAAVRAAPVTADLGATARVARMAGVGSEIGSVGAEAGALGAKTAMLQGGLSSREEDAAGKLKDAVTHAPLGYALGRGGQFIGGKIASAAEHVVDAVRYGGDAQAGAVRALARGLDQASVAPADIRAQMMIDTGRRAITEDGQEAVLRAYGTALDAGMTEAQARAAARTAYRGTSGVAAKTADGHVKHILDGYVDANRIPLALDELAQAAGSRAQNLQWTRRAAMNSPDSAGREVAAEAIMGRQERIIPEFRSTVSKSIGGEDFDHAVNALVTKNRASENAAYGKAFAAEKPFDLSPIMDRYNTAYAFRGGDVRSAMDKALATMRGLPDKAGQYQRHTLGSYIESRSALNDLVDASLNPTTRRPTAATRALLGFKEEMDTAVRAGNPEWWTANLATAEGRGIEKAMRKGAEIPLTPGPRQRQALREFEAASADEQEAARLGFARVLHDQLSKLGDTHDPSKLFLKGGKGATDGVRKVMETVLGKEAAGEMMQLIERSAIATRTNRFYGNSQTKPLEEAMKDQNKFSALLSYLQLASPSKIAEKLGELASAKINSARNDQILKRYSVMSDQPHKMFDLLDEIKRLNQARPAAFSNPRVSTYSAPGYVSAVSADPFNDAMKDRRK